MTDWLNIILGGLGSIASIIGLMTSIKNEREKKNKILFSVIIALTLTTTMLSYKYKRLTDDLLNIQLRKQNVKREAKSLLDKNPSVISYFEPGTSEGVMYSTLTLLESNKDIFPETYEAYKKNVISKIEKADSETDIIKKREQLEIAGNSALQLLKALSE